MFIFSAHKVEALVKLEAQYGQLPGVSPAVDDVLEFLKTVCLILYGFSYVVTSCMVWHVAGTMCVL